MSFSRVIFDSVSIDRSRSSLWLAALGERQSVLVRRYPGAALETSRGHPNGESWNPGDRTKKSVACLTGVRYRSYTRKKYATALMTAAKSNPTNARLPRKPAPPPSISDAEWVVMKVAWEKGTVTANQVVTALE